MNISMDIPMDIHGKICGYGCGYGLEISYPRQATIDIWRFTSNVGLPYTCILSAYKVIEISRQCCIMSKGPAWQLVARRVIESRPPVSFYLAVTEVPVVAKVFFVLKSEHRMLTAAVNCAHWCQIKSAQSQWRSQEFATWGCVRSLSPLLSLLFSSPRLLKSRPLKYSYGVWGVLWASPAGSGAERQRKSNFTHFSLKIWHLVAPILRSSMSTFDVQKLTQKSGTKNYVLSWVWQGVRTLRTLFVYAMLRAEENNVVARLCCPVPSVCLSVTFRYVFHTGWNTSKI